MSFSRPSRSMGSHSTSGGIVSTTKTRIAKVGVVCIPVSDQDRAIGFYVDKLGLEKRADTPFGNGYRWVEVGPARGGDPNTAVAPPRGEPARQQRKRGGA